MKLPALAALTPAALTRVVPGVALPEARKAVAGFHREGQLRPRPGLGRATVDAIRSATSVERLVLRERHPSSVDAFVRYLLEAPDGSLVESVRIPLERQQRHSVCVSSQVGCAMACVYCATGRLGLGRNLAAWEIVEQVRVVREDLGELRGRAGGPGVHGVLFQGMGEPLANLDAVLEAISVFTDSSAFAIDARTITVSTVGLPRSMVRLSEAAPKVRLAISIGSARAEVRRRLFPLDATHGLDEVLDAAAVHATRTGLAPLWAVTLLEGVNDSEADAVALAERVLEFRVRTRRRPRVSIVPYNAIDLAGGEAWRRSSPEREKAFRAVLSRAGVPSHRRMSGGGDVQAACGQLRSSARPWRNWSGSVVG